MDKDGIGAGDCVEFDRSPADVAIAAADCASRDGVYEVAAILDDPDAGCPADDYDTYRQAGRDEFTLCLVLNATAGDCFDGILGPCAPTAARRPRR